MKNSALILSGGGARAAYQVGVLSAVGKIFFRGHPLPFDILCGTSAGALNAAMLATYSEDFRLATGQLSYVWKHLTHDQIYRASRWPLASSLTKSVISTFKKQSDGDSLSLMENTPLKHLLERYLQLDEVQNSIDQGRLKALVISAMNYSNGKSECFFQGTSSCEEWNSEKHSGIRQNINHDHLLASSAIPILFPAQKINTHYYGDGAIRQRSALSPALKLGATELFIIGVSRKRKKDRVTNTEETPSRPPSIAQIAGQLMNSAFIDNLEEDIKSLSTINRLLANSNQTNENETLKKTNTLIVSPSEEINDIALEHIETLPKTVYNALRHLGANSDSGMATAASYLLFSQPYLRALIQLGYKDAMWEKDRIEDFFYQKSLQKIEHKK
ncbi:patatin-like phospholipase family protein [Marinomonas mediterranea]|jgi:Predicted esterase of the alpha-beta hydrolase superfamily|uniref:Patatin n=1 Tax=Marinomonas mediterranea (strain ATCC 700492 / JCM 21426 / NBRC 103028 / MMB-1) TaxID=717774 RepID=F2K3E9_MARM1|nr:patatin-like phospholipase family protein [Marinomonas mediterranea]ADZ91291.1 Patatin [Marinomonas mediterranea MMB-1]WCN09262.1 patatin-like phospholipase family protein [Marinomonas mediterranea]WCN13344.1 patatin-like phospholipase family protein [Marinomonas mediterranea]WCN17412.1 patatin-like phospholipase family protein [Marinomonas mediterranea MMB-1]